MRTSQWKDEKFVERESNTTTWMFELEVLTPIFGGGVEIDGTQKPIDPRTPIRVSAIRGQLRFWWRATNPAGCTTVDELRIAEKRLFGAARLSDDEDVGALSLSVPTQPTIKGREVFQGRNVSKTLLGTDKEAKGIPYGAFPLRDTENFETHGTLTEVTRFALRISLQSSQEHERQLACALWAWLNFGGIGGRTRRGFGSVHLVSTTGVPGHLPFNLETGWEHYSKTFARRDWPTLPQNFNIAVAERVARAKSTRVEALEELLQKLQHLRQGEEVGRRRGNQDPRRPGRSYWPEPDSVRKIRGQSAPQHREPITRTGEFPRAAFGTPLIIQFGRAGEKSGEPRSSTVNPTGKKRLASPLVLRVAINSLGQLSLRALRLDHPHPSEGFSLAWDDRGRKGAQPVKVKLEDVNFGVDTTKSPLIKNGREFTDPIARFFEELKQ